MAWKNQTGNSLAKKIKQELDAGKFVEATESRNERNELEDVITASSNSVDFFNFLLDSGMDPVSLTASELSQHTAMKRYSRYLNSLRSTACGDGDLDSLMDGVIKKKLKIIPNDVQWGGQSDLVFSAMEGDFMKPRIDESNYLGQERRVDRCSRVRYFEDLEEFEGLGESRPEIIPTRSCSFRRARR